MFQKDIKNTETKEQETKREKKKEKKTIYLFINPSFINQQEKTIKIIFKNQNQNFEMNQFKELNSSIWYFDIFDKINQDSIFQFQIIPKNQNQNQNQNIDEIERNISKNENKNIFFEFGSEKISSKAKVNFLDILISFNNKSSKTPKILSQFKNNINLLQIDESIIKDFFDSYSNYETENDKSKILKMLFLMKKEYIPDIITKILSTKLEIIYDKLIKSQLKDIFQSLFEKISTDSNISEDIIIQYLPIFIYYNLKVIEETNEDIEKSNESFKKLLTFFFFENKNEDERKSKFNLLIPSIDTYLSITKQSYQILLKILNKLFNNLNEIPHQFFIKIIDKMQSQINQIDNIEQFIDIWKPLSSLFIQNDSEEQKEQEQQKNNNKKKLFLFLKNILIN
ncbi:hypothetical protein M0811_12137 [Anaeramoeba ignava]|uniref:Uncharacterized protein n=1 Tax=Anaeramoeba ignava TaxID=1746090 RepID=A0A9Q0R6W5_ANAIG|nr:hypothetical protein M0811_12137 [Anaeramoeba ignava]